MNNPFEIEMDRRGNPSLQGWPAGEMCTATIEFEGARTSYDATAAKNHERFAITDVEPAQAVRIDMQLPVQNSVIHNWDANTLADAAHGDGAAVTVWPDSAGTNDLIAKIGSTFDPTINRVPAFLRSSNVFTGLPTVSFVNITGQISTVPSAMITTSETSLFPNKRGTVFWVWAHTNDAIHTTDTEFGLWGLQRDTLDDQVEQVHVAGASNQLFPMNARFRPVDAADDLRLATSSQGAIPAATPTIYMLSRNTDTTLRFRTNGIERTGKTILDNPGYSGKLHVNNQTYVPQFDATLTGEFGQFLVFNKALKDDEIDDMERYLSLRWGIELGQVSF